MSTLIPDSTDNCWLCDFHNASGATLCDGCGGLTIPTRHGQTKLEFKTTSYDPHAPKLNSAHASLFLDDMSAFDVQERTAIKIGTGVQQARAHAQAVKDSLQGPNKPKFTRRVYPAVIIVRTPEDGTRFTISEWKDDEEGHKYGAPTVEITKWKDENEAFWDKVNLILDLDTNSPVGEVFSAVFDHHNNCD